MRWCVALVVSVMWMSLMELELTLAQHSQGVPLPPTSAQPQHDPGVPLAPASVSSPSSSVGVALPPPGPDSFGVQSQGRPVVVVPLEQNVGVPLPPPGSHGAAHSTTGGIPLPPRGSHGAAHSTTGGIPLPPRGSHGAAHSTTGGIPLPPRGSHGAAPLPSRGIPLPPPGSHNVALSPTGGIPLPHPGSHGIASSPTVGIPLPPFKGIGSGGTTVGPPSLAGGLKPVRNLNVDGDVQRAVGLAAVRNHLQLRTKSDKAVKITGVISAHKQIVSGQLLYLTLRVGETKCPIGVPNLNACILDPSEDEHVCEVVVWDRPWLNSSKVITEKSRCAEMEDDNDFNKWGQHVLLPVPSPSEVTLHELPQGIEEQQVGVEAFNYIDHGSESKFRGDLVAYDLTSIKYDSLTDTTQVQVDVEYGFTLCLKSRDQLIDNRECPPDTQRSHYVCSVVVLHNPNQITSLEVVPILDDDDNIHCERRRSVDEELVVPVAAPCPGCPQPAPLNDPTILEVADFALREYDRTSVDEDSLHVILQLIKAHSQMVAGVKYFLTMELAETVCKKTLYGADVNRTFCTQDLTEDTKICDLQIIDQPWIPTRDLISARCYDRDSYPVSSHDEFIVPVSLGGSFGGASPYTPLLLGVETSLDVDKRTMDVVRMVVNEYNRREDDREYYKLVRVHETTSEMLGNGRQGYRVVVELGETTCIKGDPAIGAEGNHCPLDPTEEHEVCEAEVHELSTPRALQTHRILSLRCDDLDDYLRKKLMPTLSPSDVTDHPFLDVAEDTSAGYLAVATNDSSVLEAAVFVADQFNLREDEDELFVLGQVVSALSQSSSSGIRYHLEVELDETHCKKYQLVVDPRRCSVDHSEEREVCQAEVLIPHDPGSAKQLVKLYCDEINDYYTRKIRGRLSNQGTFNQHTDGPFDGGVWMDASVDDEALKNIGNLIADEYDSRSDDDSLFVFHKVLKARKQVVAGIRYQVVVELLETVCPKYKRRINKARCAPDIGEDHVVCEAHVLSQPWLKHLDISHLRCAEKDDFFESDGSAEVLFPKVHPSAHARPVFKSHFIVRSSDESEESNERFYTPSGRSSSRRTDTDEDDSDERWHVRGRRSLLGAPSDVDLTNADVSKVAIVVGEAFDLESNSPYSNTVEVIHAQSQVVAGKLWKLEVSVHPTTCLKGQQQEPSACERDPSKSAQLCTVTVLDQAWIPKLKVKSMKCRAPEDQV